MARGELSDRALDYQHMNEESGEQKVPGEQLINCPHCAESVQVLRGAAAQIVACPQCGQSFIVPGLDGTMPAVASIPGEGSFAEDDRPSTAHRDDEIDGIRIRQIAQMRRAAYRSRSYFLIAVVALAACAGQLIWYAVTSVKAHQFLSACLYLLGAALCAVLAWRWYGRAETFKQEAERSALEEPKTPPDFSKLSDGSQRYKNLDDVQ